MATQQKIDTVTSLSEKVPRATAIILADYRGLKHKQLEELRRTLKKSNAQFLVTKNTLLKRALGDKATSLGAHLQEATGALFSFADEAAPLKDLLKFFKSAGNGKTKGGLLGSTALNEAEIIRLASIPARPILLGQLVGQLNAPIQGLHRALSWNINKLVWVLKEVTVHGKTN